MCFSLQSSSDVVDCGIQVRVSLVSKNLLFCQQPAKHEVQAKTATSEVHKELEHEDYVCKEPSEPQSEKARFTVTEVDGECSPEEVRGFAQISKFYVIRISELDSSV